MGLGWARHPCTQFATYHGPSWAPHGPPVSLVQLEGIQEAATNGAALLLSKAIYMPWEPKFHHGQQRSNAQVHGSHTHQMQKCLLNMLKAHYFHKKCNDSEVLKFIA